MKTAKYEDELNKKEMRLQDYIKNQDKFEGIVYIDKKKKNGSIVRMITGKILSIFKKNTL